MIEIKPGISKKKSNQIIYEPIKTKITSIQRGKFSIQEAGPGGSLAFETELDPVLTKADSLAGCVASLEGKLPEISNRIKIKYKLFPEVLGEEKKTKTEPLKHDELILLSVNTTTTVGQIINIKEDEIEVDLRIPIVPIKRDSLGLARNIRGHWRLIGWGEVL